MSKLVITKHANYTHNNLIKDSWLKSFYYTSKFCENLDWEVYFPNQSELIDRLLKKSKIIIAESLDNPDVVVGYIVYEGDIVHYVYVKHVFKRFGIAKELYTHTGLRNFRYTHRTSDCNWLFGYIKKEKMEERMVKIYMPGRLPDCKYNPYLLMGGV